MTARAGRVGAAWGAVCGVLAAAVAIGIAQLLAGLSIPNASPVIAVGQVAINLTPLPVKDWATSTFGNNDKNVLLTGVVVVVFLYAIVVGVVAMRRLSYGFCRAGDLRGDRPGGGADQAARDGGLGVPDGGRRAGRGVRAVPAGDRGTAGFPGQRCRGPGTAGDRAGFRWAAADRVRRAGG